MAEVAAALAAKHRAPGGITRDERDKALSLFLSHCETDYILVSVDRSVIERAVYWTHQHPLRGYDAVQLASAVATNEALRLAGLMPLIFVAANIQLLAAARAEGLTVENPAEIGRTLLGSR